MCVQECESGNIIEELFSFYFPPHISFGAPLRGASSSTFRLDITGAGAGTGYRCFSSSTSKVQDCFSTCRHLCMVIVGPWDCESHLQT